MPNLFKEWDQDFIIIIDYFSFFCLIFTLYSYSCFFFFKVIIIILGGNIYLKGSISLLVVMQMPKFQSIFASKNFFHKVPYLSFNSTTLST